MSTRANGVGIARRAGVSLALLLVGLAGCVDDDVVAVATVTVSPPALTMVAGTTAQLTAEPRDQAGNPLADRPVGWASSDLGVAEVSPTGLVTARAPGGPVTITATSEDRLGAVAVTVLVPVASVTVAPSLPPMIVGSSAQLRAELRASDGGVVTGRVVTWASSAPDRLAISAAGVVTAIAPGGPVDLTATVEGQRGAVALVAVPGIVTGIADVRGFLERCPTSDPAYPTIRQHFELRSDGAPVTGPLPCTEPYSTTPIAQLTDELYALQALRVAYYMSLGTQGRLPWTPLSFYDWLHARVGGINLKSAPGQLYCCDQLDGRLFIAMSRQPDWQREFKRDWPGLSSTLAFFAHEARHADPGAPGHVRGCPAFPLPTDPPGCDPSYDLGNLGAYGVQHWLQAGWATGALHVGLRCAPETLAATYLADHVAQARGDLDRFVTTPPPAVTGQLTYGGPCP